MKLTVVGCSGSYPGPRSAASCYLVEAEGYRVVLDLGNGALGTLARHTDIRAIDAVLLSHLHPDHYFDVCSLYVARHYDPTGTHARLPVYGPQGVAARLFDAYGPGSRPGMEAEFDVREWRQGEATDLGPFRVTVARVAHPVEAYAMRLEYAGRVLVYSGDTGPTDALVGLARDADLLLCEASFVDGAAVPPDLHLSGRQAADHASRAGVGRLVLTHVPPWHDPEQALAEAVPAFDGPVELARPGMAHDL